MSQEKPSIKPSILLLSTSSEITEALHSILDSDYELIRAKTLTQAFEILDSKKAPIAILDFAAAISSNGDTIEQLKKHKPQLVTLLVCPRDKREQLLESNLSTEAYRVLFATLSPGQTRLAVAAALKHAKAKAAEMPKVTKEKKSNTKTAKPSQARPTSTGSKSSSKLIPLIAGIGIIALAGVTWMFLSGDKDAIKTATSDAVKIVKTPAQLEADRLSLTAKTSFESGAFFPPEDNNALDSYSKVLELDPNNLVAKKALLNLSRTALGDLDLHIQNASIADAQTSIDYARKLGATNSIFSEIVESTLIEKKSALIEEIEKSLESGSTTDAASLVTAASSLFSNDEKIASLQKTISEKQQSLNQAAEITNLVSKSRTAINANRLLSPERNNAQYFINRLETLDSGNAALSGLKRNLSSTLLLEARTSALDNDYVNAKRYVDSAARLGASPAAITSERQRITSLESKLKEQLLAEEQVAESLAEEQLIAETEKLAQEQADAQAASAKKAEVERAAEAKRLSTVPVEVVLSELTTTKRVSPEYPNRYLKRGLEGSAQIAFTVSREGVLSNVRVVSTTPDSAKSFGKEAESAVKQWQFKPYKDEDGNTRIANSQVKINFQL